MQVQLETQDTYNPSDFIFENDHAQRFTKNWSRKCFDAWLVKFRVKIVRRGGKRLFFRADLEDALNHERNINGELRNERV